MADAKKKVVSINDRKDFDKKMKQTVMDAYEEINQLKAKRAEINDSISSVLSRLEGHNFNRKAVKAAFTFLDMDDDKRTNWDTTMVFIRNAGGQPLQGTLFDANMSTVFLGDPKDTDEE